MRSFPGGQYSIDSGQITIIPKPELSLFWEDSPTITTFWGDQPAVNGRYNLTRLMRKLKLRLITAMKLSVQDVLYVRPKFHSFAARNMMLGKLL